MFLRLITDREREKIEINMCPCFSTDWHETLGADSCNLPEVPATLVHLVLFIRAMPICASVLQRLVITTMLTKVGQLRCEGGCTGRGVAAWGGEVESDDSPRKNRADPMKRRDYFLVISREYRARERFFSDRHCLRNRHDRVFSYRRYGWK